MRALFFKELRHLVRDRVLQCCIVALIVAVAASIWLSAAELRRRQDEYERNVELHTRAVALNTAYRDLAWTGVVVDQRPNALTLLVKGVGDSLPSAITVSLGTRLVNELDYRLVQNQWSKLIGHFDVAFLVLTFGSLLAILTTYKTISGEREAGTLRLIMASNTTRGQVLAAKLLAPCVMLLVSTGIALLAALAFSAIALGVRLSMEFIAVAVALWLISALYTSGFALIGVWCSAMTARSVTGLSLLTVIWAVLVFVAPSAAIVAATHLRPVPSRDSVLEQKQLAVDAQWLRWSQRQQTYQRTHGHAAYYDVSSDWLIEREIGIANDVARIDDAHQMRSQAQVSFAVRLARLSPAFAFFDIASNLADTGLESHRRFFTAVREFRGAFSTFMVDAVKRDPIVPDPTATLDFSSLPAFAPPTPTAGDAVRPSLASLFVLVAFTAIGAFGSIASFRRAAV